MDHNGVDCFLVLFSFDNKIEAMNRILDEPEDKVKYVKEILHLLLAFESDYYNEKRIATNIDLCVYCCLLDMTSNS